jgi:hypothetical protein
MSSWLTTASEIGASLMLASVNAVVALALIAFSLSLAIAVSLVARFAPARATVHSPSLRYRRLGGSR